VKDARIHELYKFNAQAMRLCREAEDHGDAELAAMAREAGHTSLVQISRLAAMQSIAESSRWS
jgi:hypothetical protein